MNRYATVGQSYDAILARLATFCDCCDASLTPDELDAGERWGQSLCDACAQGYAEANPEKGN